MTKAASNGVENGAELLPDVMAHSNIDGVYEAYDTWPGKQQLTLRPEGAEGISVITSRGMGDYSDNFQADRQNNLTPDDQEEFYIDMPDELARRYRFDLPAGTTIQGSAELRAMLDSDREDLDGLMITAILMDVSDQGAFPVYAPTEENGGTVAAKTLSIQYKFDDDPDDGLMNLMDFDQIKKPRRIISFAWTDLQNPGCGKNSSDYVYQDPGLISGTEQAYTFYFLPMVYTVAEGHHLELVLTTWDPYRVQLDAWFNLDGSLETRLDEDTYSYDMIINNGSLELILPTGVGDPDWLGKVPEISESEIAQTVNTRILIVGAGNAGLMASARASSLGGQVTVIDKGISSTTERNWIGALGTREAAACGAVADKNLTVAELCRYASHRCDEKLIRLWADRSGEVVDWYYSLVQTWHPDVELHMEWDVGRGAIRPDRTALDNNWDEAGYFHLGSQPAVHPGWPAHQRTDGGAGHIRRAHPRSLRGRRLFRQLLFPQLSGVHCRRGRGPQPGGRLCGGRGAGTDVKSRRHSYAAGRPAKAEG